MKISTLLDLLYPILKEKQFSGQNESENTPFFSKQQFAKKLLFYLGALLTIIPTKT